MKERRRSVFAYLLSFAINDSLKDSDDDVCGVAASALVPLVSSIVESMPAKQLDELLGTIDACLGDLKDDLSSSVGNVMELLANLIKFPPVVDMLQDDTAMCVAPSSYYLRSADRELN